MLSGSIDWETFTEGRVFKQGSNGSPWENAGDVQPVGEGVSELRIHYGPGYRVYFKQREKGVIILLAGGTRAPKPMISEPLRDLRVICGSNFMKKIKTTRYDVAQHLRTPEEMSLIR